MAINNFLKPIFLRVKKSRALSFLATYLLYVVMRALYASYRLEFELDPSLKHPFERNGGIFYFWHQQVGSVLFFFFKMKSMQNCIISPSNDGKIAGAAVAKLGFNIIYGSVFKNPIQVTRQSLRVLGDNQQLCIVGDGSRGPAFELKRGVPFLAIKAGVPMFFVEGAPSWYVSFKKSWDKFQVPLPFSKIKIRVYKCDPEHVIK
jgi:lysophospholipid acyltransferase (LPLAT)-like uncharacterized protein